MDSLYDEEQIIFGKWKSTFIYSWLVLLFLIVVVLSVFWNQYIFRDIHLGGLVLVFSFRLSLNHYWALRLIYDKFKWFFFVLILFNEAQLNKDLDPIFTSPWTSLFQISILNQTWHVETLMAKKETCPQKLKGTQP